MKRIFAILLAIMFAFSMFSTAFANENVDATDVVLESEVVAESEDEIVAVEETDEELSLDENVQVITLPILRDKDESVQTFSLMGGTASSGGGGYGDSYSDNSIVIMSAYSEDFYADSDEFEIRLYMENYKDARKNLKLEVVDAYNTVIAKQTSVYYRDYELVYKMKLQKEVDEYASYSIKFTYSGKYDFYCEEHNTYIWPITEAAIKEVELISRANNSFRLLLANANPGEKYTLMYSDYWNEDSPVIKDATVTSDESLLVEFGDEIPFSNQNYIFLCPEGSTSIYDRIDEFELWRFNSYDDSYNNYDNGIYCEDYISANASEVWVNLWSKGFYNARYSESDVDNVNVYMFDITEGKTVGTLSKAEYQAEYNQINGYVDLSTKLNDAHNYIMVFNDGYTVRIYDGFKVISSKMLTDINAYDLNKEFMQTIPVGTKTFYAYANSLNISDRSNIKVELVDASGKTVATSSYESQTGYFKMTAKSALAEGKYTLKSTYDKLVRTKSIEVASNNKSNSMYFFDQVAFNGKTYLGIEMETNLDPSDLTYKVVMADGTEKVASYHRKLYDDENYKYFVIVLNEELTEVTYGAPARLDFYNGSDLITFKYNNNNISWINYFSSPFVYNAYKTTSSTVEMFLEGFSGTGTFSLCGYDELTQTGVSVKAASVSKTSAKFNKSDLNKINLVCKSNSSSSYAEAELQIELNDEYLTSIWTSAYQGVVNVVYEPTFDFQKDYSTSKYVILNLPYTTYDYYKIATSKSELSSKSYKKMDVGVLYELKAESGEQTVYAQFKTSAGVESEVKTATITIDVQIPTIEFLEIPEKLEIVDDRAVLVSVVVNVNESGSVYLELYDENDAQIGYDQNYVVGAGENVVQGYFWLEDYNFEDATKLVVYMMDSAGNMTKDYSFDVSIVKEYSYYTSGNTTMRIHNETGSLDSIETSDSKVVIPDKIDGVTVTSIGEYVFSYYEGYITISIPESVTNIDENAFANLYSGFKLLVKENSAAHQFALANDIAFDLDSEVSTYKKGDILEDGVINAKDAVKLAQYLAKWDIALSNNEKNAADVVVDGIINAKDAVKLAQYLARWDITLD